jgi:hypothetical protein
VCGLRAAIQEANALAGPDVISLPAGFHSLALAGASEDADATGDLDITDALTITGAGAATTFVDGSGLDRVFDVDPAGAGIDVSISGVTVQYGLAPQQGLTSLGGGIQNHGRLRLSGSSVVNNRGVALDTFGGGLCNDGGTVEIDDCTVGDNQAVSGAGVYNGSGGTLTLRRSTVSGNSAGAYGGGISTVGVLTVENSTISGNTSFYGGGIYAYIAGSATLVSCTVTRNRATWGGGLSVSGSLTLKNTIVARNTADGSGGDCLGTMTSDGHNLDSDGSCGLAAAGDQSGVDPMLGPLANNGGPTGTHALFSGSAAVDAGSHDCPPPAVDQRGFPRPEGAACDIGAFELGKPVPARNITWGRLKVHYR